MRNYLLAEEADGMEHLLVLRRPDGAQQNRFLDAEGFVQFEKADAVLGRADAEFRALLSYLLGRRLARVWPTGEPLVARVIALIVWRDGCRVIVAPHQPGALALLLDVPRHQFGAALGHDLRVFVAIARRHQRGARAGRGSAASGGPERLLICRHQLPDALRAAFAAEQPAHPQAARRRAVSSLPPADHSGGCGCCTGFGRT